MWLQLRQWRACAAIGVALLIAAPPVGPSRANAEDRVTVRGAYYREASTRVVQPVVEISKDLPNGVDLNAHYLLDAITSASVAAGTAGGDAIFTEVRNEVGLAAGWNVDRMRLTAAYHYSAESDYWSHGVGASVAVRFWGDSATVSWGVGTSWDGAWPRNRTPDCPTAMELACRMRSYFASLGYTQIWSPTLITQLSVESIRLDGFQSSLYRTVPSLGYEKEPSSRLRVVLSPRAAYYVPESRTGFQLQYRYYDDDWSLSSHMVEGRVYQQLASDLEVRVSYRYYSQAPAYFSCDGLGRGGPACYDTTATIYTSDPKLNRVRTSMPELKVIWDATRLRGAPFFGWFSEGSFEISYARYFQSTSFGNAHLLQTGYSIPY